MSTKDHRTIQPYLFFEGRCEEAIAFYQKTLGAEKVVMMYYKDSPEPPPPGCVPPGSEIRPKTTGRPGWISAPVIKNSAPSEASTGLTKSYLPLETPPVTRSKSALIARMEASSARGSSFATG